MSQELGISPQFQSIGPWMVGDNVGFTVALQILKASQLEVKYSTTSQEFETVRQIRTVDSRLFQISGVTAGDKLSNLTFTGKKGQVMRITNARTNSLLYSRFSDGLLSHMGRDTRSDIGLDVFILIEILKNLEADLQDVTIPQSKR